MSAEQPFTPPKKKISVFWWLGGLLLILLIIFLVQLFGPSPRIVASKQTTFITSPLLPNGLPDYEAYIRQQRRAGVTPENNAAVLLWQAIWPGELKPQDFEAVAAELGLNEIPSAESAVQPLHGKANQKRVADWLQKLKPQAPASGSEIEPPIEPDAEAVIDAAMQHAWTSQQVPPLAEWIAANQKPLDLLEEATHRSRFYSPSPTLLNNQDEMVLSMQLPGQQAARNAARALLVRALWNIGENRPADAWRDILAMHRLSALMTQGGTLVEQLIGMAIRTMACNATAELLSSKELPKDLAHQIQQDVAGLPQFTNIVEGINDAERVATLDAVIHITTQGFSVIADSTGASDDTDPVDYASINWNIVLRKVNQTYDQVVAAMRLQDREERQAAMRQFERDLNVDVAQVRQPGQWVAAFFSRDARSDLMAKIMIGLMMPALQAASDAEDRTNSMLELTKIASALAVYRTEHNAYPASLDELSPGILPKVPTDLYHNKPYVYKRTTDGYLLYSLGENGRDDGGSNEVRRLFQGTSTDDLDSDAAEAASAKTPKDADDIVIRLPLPKFKMPRPTATE